ncbi:MAG: DUF1570 domain-containing protein [Planctomycetota bacterium]|jgi:hypothetical protein|nr:DUF1570 domain-containing protein [Planctomycetota bacterium]
MRHRIHKRVLPALFAAGLALAGCANLADPPESGLEVAEYESAHYRLRLAGTKLGDQGEALARRAALLMEKMFDIYSGLDEVPLPPGDPMPFWLHLDRRDYDRQAALYEFPEKTTNGFCTTSGEVHVYYRRLESHPPEATAMHEGFHQYCHRALHYPTPPEVFQRVPGYKLAKLPTVPLWLAEGMAMNLESGRVETDHNGMAVGVNDVGTVNRARLEHLTGLISSGRCPPLRSILNLIMGDQINIDSYAVMWGLVFDLRMATGDAIFFREQREMERAGPEATRAAMDAAIDPYRSHPYLRWPVPVVGRLLRACRVAWGLDIPALVEVSAAGAREPRDFDRQWNRRLTQAALSELEKLLQDNGETLDQWEAGWRKRMLTLQAEVGGGHYRYVEPASARRPRASRDHPPGAW